MAQAHHRILAVSKGALPSNSWIQDIRAYKEFVTSPVDVLIELIEEKGATRASVGIELEYLGAQYFNELSKHHTRGVRTMEMMMYKTPAGERHLRCIEALKKR